MRTWLAGSAENAVMRYPGRLRYFQAKWTLVEVEFKIVSETWDTPTYKLNSVDSFRKSTDFLRGFQRFPIRNWIWAEFYVDLSVEPWNNWGMYVEC